MLNPPLLPDHSIFRKLPKLFTVFACGLCLWFLVPDHHALAQQLEVPWECSEYTGDAQTRCMKTLLELQQDKIIRLEERLKAQEGTVSELKDRLDRQAELARQETDSSSHDLRYPPLAYSYTPFYGYGPLTPPIGIYLGTPWRYSRPYFGYSPRFWGRPGLSFNFRFGGGHRHRHR